MSTSSLRRVLLALALMACGAGAASAQSDLGGQRAGTSSGSFLRIGVGARSTGMGESFVAVANDPSAIFWNPAGLASLLRREVAISHVEWPAEIGYEHVTLVVPTQKLGGSFGLQFGVLSTRLDETTELQPYGTGRSFVYSDMVAGAAYARRWTDKLLVGFGLKYVREDLGSDVGGPTTSAVLFDVGSIYYLGLGSVRIATSLSNFGSEFKPSGEYISPYSGERRIFDGYDPPMMFRYGVAFEPVENAHHRVTAAIEVNQPADNQQLLKAGGEWSWDRRFMLRSGYNFTADDLNFSAGAGFALDLSGTRGQLDYAYTDGGFLGAIHRVSLGVRF